MISERVNAQSRRKDIIQKYISDMGCVEIWVLWTKILELVESKGTTEQKKELHFILVGTRHPGTIRIRDFLDQFLSLTKDKISGKTDSLLIFNLFSSIDSALLK